MKKHKKTISKNRKRVRKKPLKRKYFNKVNRMSERILSEEDKVNKILEKATREGRFYSSRKTNDNEKVKGKDFVVQKEIKGKIATRSFGVKISARDRQDSILKHPSMPCFLILPEMKEKTLLRKIDNLFK